MIPQFSLPSSSARRRGAFTLVELLVSMTVMVLLVVLIAQLTNSATNATTASSRRLDADAQARIAFTRMAYDFSNMILRPDVDSFFVKNNGGSKGANDAMYFYSEAPGYFSNDDNIHSPVSLVGYRIANRQAATADPLYPDNVLERVAAGLNFDGGTTAGLFGRVNLVFLTFPSPNPTATAATPQPSPDKASTIPGSKGFVLGTGPTWDNPTINSSLNNNSQNFSFCLSDSIFRMEFCFIMKDPNKAVKNSASPNPFVAPTPAGSSPWTSSSFMFDDHDGDGLISMRQITKDAAGIVVTLAALDSKARTLLSLAQTKAMRESLLDGNGGSGGFNANIAKKWNDDITAANYRTTTGLPQQVISQIHVYQRIFYFNSK